MTMVQRAQSKKPPADNTETVSNEEFRKITEKSLRKNRELLERLAKV